MGKWWILLASVFVLMLALKGRSLILEEYYLEHQLEDCDSIACGLQVSETYYWAEIALGSVNLDVYSPSGSHGVLTRGPALLPIFPIHTENEQSPFSPYPSGLEVIFEFDSSDLAVQHVEFDMQKSILKAKDNWVKPNAAFFRTPAHYSSDIGLDRIKKGPIPLGTHVFELDKGGYNLMLRYPVRLEDIDSGVTLEVDGLLINGAAAHLPTFRFIPRSKRHIHWAISRESEELLLARSLLELQYDGMHW